MRIEESVGARIRAAREKQGWSLAQLGEHLQPYLGRAWSPQAVWQAEHGQRDFKVAHLLAFGLALRMPLGRLISPLPSVEGDIAIGDDGYTLTDDDVLVLFAPSGTLPSGLETHLWELVDRLDKQADDLQRMQAVADESAQVARGTASTIAAVLNLGQQKGV